MDVSGRESRLAPAVVAAAGTEGPTAPVSPASSSAAPRRSVTIPAAAQEPPPFISQSPAPAEAVVGPTPESPRTATVSTRPAVTPGSPPAATPLHSQPQPQSSGNAGKSTVRAGLVGEPATGQDSSTPRAPLQSAPEPTVRNAATDAVTTLDSLVPAATAIQAEATDDPQRDASRKYDNLWSRLRAGFGMPDLESPLVERHELYYSNRPEYLQRIVERGRRYLHFIVEEVEKRGMPLEIALLPMIESAYNPAAYSKAHASGMWQFIPATGKTYGLKQNWWYDGRRDVMAATRAALDYLQKLHTDFGDWQLALAAYNWGEGAVSRAIERNVRRGLPTDYSSLNMPAETRNYLPKLQAVKNIVAAPERFGMALDDVPNEPYFIRVAAPGHMDFKRAAQLADVPLEEFRSLNPAYNRPVIAAAEEQSLLIPADKAEVFEENLKSLEEPLLSWQTYRLPQPERLESVASRFRTSVALLRQVNGIKGNGRLKAGSTLLVPRPTGGMQLARMQDSIDTEAFLPPELLVERQFHRVRKGESLQQIAAAYSLSPKDLMAWNRLKTEKLRVGTQLRLQAGTAPVTRTATVSKQKAKAVSVEKTRRSGVAQKDSKKIAVEHRGKTRSAAAARCCRDEKPRQIARGK
ncbi:MAG: transglycosylase SLT domain-containing protein [Betaproteobacteria bacterium]|nr:transglycosylase SLT domain-containing protein [Betaproteobacteria bacterium]